MKRLKAIFSGMVQGVGFRMGTERLARQFAVTGYVRNLSDGNVEVVAEGEEDEVSAFLTSIRESSLKPYIRNLETSWQAANGEFRTFDIRF